MINENLLASFRAIPLEDMTQVRLMNRIDTKFVTNIRRLECLLENIAEGYYVQEIDGKFNMPYYTCYFDTPSVNMFYEHQRGKKTRQKIRMRIYEGSESPAFLEIKNKNNKGRTKKNRIPMDNGTALANYSDFINDYLQYPVNSLVPMIENRFNRITLVNNAMTERITIDTGLVFHNLNNNGALELVNIGIVEWKRSGGHAQSMLERHLRDLHIHPSGFSKYCIGMAGTDSTLRQNRLRQKIRLINRINLSF